MVQHAIKLSVKEHLFGPEHVSTDETSQDSGLSRVHSPESGDDGKFLKMHPCVLGKYCICLLFYELLLG